MFSVGESKIAQLRYYGMFRTSAGLHLLTEIMKTWEGPIRVVYEDFMLVSVHVNLDPIKTIGAIEFWVGTLKLVNKMENIEVVHAQAPGERMFVEKRFNKPYSHVKDHARSALLHGMAYMYKRMGEVYKYTEHKGAVLF